MYDDDDNILLTVEEQGNAFLDRFIKQSDQNDGYTRSYRLDQLVSMVKTAETDTDFTLSEVMSAISTTKNGAPGPDGVDIEVFNGVHPEVKLELTVEYNKSWRTGDIPETWTDSFINPVPKPQKDHRHLKGHHIITC